MRKITSHTNEEGWGMVLVFFVLAFLIGISLVALRNQMMGSKDLATHNVAHSEYWRANQFAADLEASLRSDLVNAFSQEVAQARTRERLESQLSRLPSFDAPHVTVSRPLVTFSPSATWIDADNNLNVPAGTRSTCSLSPLSPEGCTSLLGRIGSLDEVGSWVQRHVVLARTYAGRRGWAVGMMGDIRILRETARDSLATSEYGYDQTSYILEFVIETTTEQAGEHARVRKQGRVTLGAPAQILAPCPEPKILSLTRTPPDPVEEGADITFVWETLDAHRMRVELLNDDGTVRQLLANVSLRQADDSYTQRFSWSTAAVIEDEDAPTGVMRFRFTAIRDCGGEERRSIPVLHVVNVRRFIIAAWSAPWSQPSGDGLRRSDRAGDLVGFFHTWAEVRTSGDRLRFTVRVGYVMGNESAQRLENGVAVFPTFSGNVRVTDRGTNQPLEGMTWMPIGPFAAPSIERTYNVNRLMIPPTRGCTTRCQAGTPPGSVRMTMQYVWSVPRPEGALAGYDIYAEFNVYTIQVGSPLYSRRNGNDRYGLIPAFIPLISSGSPGGGGPPPGGPPGGSEPPGGGPPGREPPIERLP